MTNGRTYIHGFIRELGRARLFLFELHYSVEETEEDECTSWTEQANAGLCRR